MSDLVATPSVGIMWACRLSVADYASFGRNVPAPRPTCAGCHEPMAYDGSYPRRVREAGVAHRIFVRRARCRRCGVSDVLLPDFLLRNRLDSALSIGAAVIAHAGHRLEERAAALYLDVPERTVRSWRQRFAEKADELTKRFSALCVEWGGLVPRYPPAPVPRALVMIGAVEQEARRFTGERPPPWRLANIVVGGQLLSSRANAPSTIGPSRIGWSRAP
jgi:hypothetical protein